MSYKILFTDIDDTLLKNDLTISDENTAAIKKAVSRGKKIVICSGRGIFGIKKYIDALEIGNEGYVICLNGGAVYDCKTMEVISENFLPKDCVKTICGLGLEFDIPTQGYYRDKLYIEKLTEVAKQYIERMGIEAVFVPSLANYNASLSKILFTWDHKKLTGICERLMPKIGGRVNMTFSKPEYLEFTSKEATKGNAAANLCRMLGIPLNEAIAIGDGQNDKSMIMRVGLGVAVANASQELKDAADYITENTNETHAVKEVIEKFLLA
ncbi:MAG: Cof-type HAD-IIB family hydrolase [Lachnospiraceae bacterium]|nr:Cof-type HAD-IIB family hydrolase [Lachnospiraceae bacterium]